LRPAGAFASGVLLNQALAVCFGVLAAVTIPKGYFAWFGAHKVVALVIEEAAVMALPAFLIAFLWGRLTVGLSGLSRREGALWCLAGLCVAWGVSEVLFMVDFQAMQVSEPLPLPKLLMLFLVPPVWAFLSMLAPPLGVLMASGIGRRGHPPTADAVSRKSVERAASPFGDRLSRSWDGAAP